MEAPPRRPTGAREPGNVGSALEFLTDRLTIRHETGGALTWCEAEPIIAAALTSPGSGIAHPWPLGDANLRDHVTPDGHVIRIPRFGAVNAVFELLFVDEDKFGYQARLETYIEMLTGLFAGIELQALLESRRRRDPEASIKLADRLIARTVEFADLQEKIGQEALDAGATDNAQGVRQAKRLESDLAPAQELARSQGLSGERAAGAGVRGAHALGVLRPAARSGREGRIDIRAPGPGERLRRPVAPLAEQPPGIIEPPPYRWGVRDAPIMSVWKGRLTHAKISRTVEEVWYLLR